MELIAAIDVLDGRSVRLHEGDFSRRVASRLEPAELAARWAAAGVPRLHVVDLDGARRGKPHHLKQLAQLIEVARRLAPTVGVQAAGGLRSPAAVAAVIDAGADAAVLGTAALEQPRFLARCAARWPGRMLAALDIRDGQLAVDGWRRASAAAPMDAARRLLGEGAAALLVTDIRRDGMLAGPNRMLLGSFRTAFPDAHLVAAGGVRSVEDLVALRKAGVDGAIVGMAILTGLVDVRQALAALAASDGVA